MKIDTFKYFFLDALKNLKRNGTLTIFSVFTVSATIFIVGLFLIYLLSVNKNSATIFINNKGMIIIFRWLEIAVFIILPIISLFLIVNAFKMSMFPRRKEINIMKFVGATNWFIRWPFIIEGVIIGIVGAFGGNLSLFFMYSFIYTKVMEFTPELSLVQPAFITNTMLLPFTIVGAFIGPVASIIALKRILERVVWEN